jgi:predicted dehydrogenase
MRDKTRVGIVGTGWGELQFEAFRHVRGVQVAALCDSDRARLETVARKEKIDLTFAEYGEMLTSGAIDLVSIATPPELHETMVRAAIDAGKHILCEKPLGLNPRVARELLECANVRGIVHAVDLETRYLPAVAYSKELIDEDYVGHLLRVDVTMAMENPWGAYGKWAADDTRGGGVLMELGATFIDILRWWFGGMSAVLAERRTHFPTIKVPKPKGSSDDGFATLHATGDDAFWSVMQFERGGQALLSFITGSRYDPGWTIKVYGDKGSLVVNSGQLLGFHEGDREMAILPIPKRLELGDNPRDPLMWSMAKLMEQMAGKIQHDHAAEPFPDFRDGVAVAEVVDAIRRSSVERKWVNIA